MNIVVKSLKCRDCSILSGKSEKLLIDCGSTNIYKDLSSSEFLLSTIAKEMDNMHTDFMFRR